MEILLFIYNFHLCLFFDLSFNWLSNLDIFIFSLIEDLIFFNFIHSLIKYQLFFFCLSQILISICCLIVFYLLYESLTVRQDFIWIFLSDEPNFRINFWNRFCQEYERWSYFFYFCCCFGFASLNDLQSLPYLNFESLIQCHLICHSFDFYFLRF